MHSYICCDMYIYLDPSSARLWHVEIEILFSSWHGPDNF